VEKIMRHVLLSAFLVLIVNIVSCSKEDQTLDWNDSELTWLNYSDGLKELAASGKSCIFIVYADWCPTCKKYSTLFKNPAVVTALEGVILVRSNKDKEPGISKLYDIDGEYVPRTFALDKIGKIIEDLNSDNPKWWYFLPANDPDYLIQFTNMVKQHHASST
jgi:hypothetical protein